MRISDWSSDVCSSDLDYVRGTMPVDARTHQPYGLLHGGASVLLAETLGSSAGNLCVADAALCVGIEINANHLAGVREGPAPGTARPLHVGRSTQVWDVRSRDERRPPETRARPGRE